MALFTINKGLLLMDIAGSEQLLLNHIKASLDAEQLPLAAVTFTSVNAWGLRNIPAISVESKLGCDVSCTIYVMRYGRHIALAIRVGGSPADLSQQLALSCFETIVGQCIHKAIKATAAKLGREIVSSQVQS